MSTFSYWFVAISPIVGLWGIRALAIAKYERRLPKLKEVVGVISSIDNGAEEKWIKTIKYGYLVWIAIFVMLWVMGIRLEAGHERDLKLVVGLTMFYLAYFNQLGRSLIFHLYIKKNEMDQKSENDLFRSTAKLIPGGADFASRFVRFSNVALLALLIMMIVI